jgi:hypothetical protein
MDRAADHAPAGALAPDHLRTLRRHRVLVSAALALSVVGFALITYRVSLPATFEARAYHVGSATAIVLVDAPRSRAVDIAAGNGIQVLAFRAKLLADLAMKPLIMDAVAQRLGVPAALVVADPPLGLASGASGTPDDRRANVIRAGVSPVVGGDNPIMTITTRAPTPAAAQRLAGAVIAVLARHLATVSRSQGTPVARRIRLTQLAPPNGTLLQRGPRPATTAAAATLAFLIVCWSIVAIDRLARRMRQAPRPIVA